MTAAAQSPWLIPRPIHKVKTPEADERKTMVERVALSWGKRWCGSLSFWQHVVMLCVVAFFWVQLVTIRSFRRIALYGGKVAGVGDSLLKPSVSSIRLSNPVLFESQHRDFRDRGSHRHLLALVLLCILHSGEATSPGPSKNSEWTLGVCNPSGLNGKQQIINDHLQFGDTWAFTETHLSSSAMQAFKAGLWTTGSPFKYCVGGHPCPLRPHSEHVGSWSGVSVLSKHPTRTIPIAIDPDLVHSSRIQFTTTLCHDLWISGATIYGEPPGLMHPFAAEHTDVLIQTAIDTLSLMPGLRFLAGDFNFEIGSLECFDRLDELGFKDVQTIAECRWGIQPQSTCKGSTRKDYLFLSPELQQLLTDVSIIHDIWADHSVLVGHFVGHNASIATPVWRSPQQIDWPENFQLSQPLQVSFVDQDPTQAYAELWEVVESSLVSQVQHTPQQLRRAQLGRGQTFDTRIRKGFPPPRHLKPSRNGDIQPKYEGSNAQHSQWFRQLRRLQAYCRFKKAHPVDTDSAHGSALWHSVVHAKGFPRSFPVWWEYHCGTLLPGAPVSLPLIPPSYDLADLIFNTLTLEVRSLESKLKAAHRAQLRQQRSETAHLVFRDCKAEQPEKVDLFVAHKQSTVLEVNHDEQSVTIDPPVQFVNDAACYINGREAWILNADPHLLHLDDTDAVISGELVVQTPMTGKLEDLFDAFSKEWNARWNRHLHVLPSQWNQILEFSTHHLPSKRMDPTPITPSCIRAELKKKKKRSSTGPDGVSLKDLLAMPPSVIEAHSSLLARAEADGLWPEQTLVGRVASLAKQANPAQVKDYRPITVLSHCYRLWGGIRSRQLLRFVDDLCPPFLFGNRPGCHAMQLWTFVQWMIEMAHLESRPLAGDTADIQKAFNHIPREVIFHACLILGMPSGVLKGWAGALSNIQRRFQIREATSPPLFSVTGCPEGCSMSCVGMLVLDILFHRWIAVQHPLEYPLSYVDDWQVLTYDPTKVCNLLASLESFTKLVDLQLDPKKTFAWSTCGASRKALKQQHVVIQNQAKSLGAQMQFTRRHAAQVLASRLAELQPLWPRLRRSLSPYPVKVRAIVAAAWPKGLHGVAASSVSTSQIQAARAGAMRALNSNGAGCNALVHLGLSESPSTDPQFWAIMETFRSIRDSHSQVALAPLVQAALENPSPLPRGGPTRALVDRIHLLGWSIDENLMVSDSLGSFDLFRTSPGELFTRAALSWTKVVASSVAYRPLFHGLEKADSGDTRKYLRSLPQQDQGLFRKSLNGAHFANDALCYFSGSGSSKCDYCQQEDSRYHRYWDCPIFEPHRHSCPADVRDLIPALPSCLTQAGWSICPSTQEEWSRALLDIPEPEVPPLHPSIVKSEWIDVFSDGSCFWPTSCGYNIASWAITFAPPELNWTRSEVIAAGALPGLCQTAFRSEVFGAWQAIRFGRTHGISIRLWTDCLGVVNRLNKILRNKPVKPSTPHADLWMAIREDLIALGFHRLVVTKVAAHQSIDDAEGPLEQWAYLRNSLVDRAARLANLCREPAFWSLHSKHAAECEATKRVVRSVQTVILNISRSVVVRDSLRNDEDFQDCTAEIQGPKIQPPEIDRNYRLVLPCSLPSHSASRFGFRQTSLVFAWLRQAIEQSQDVAPSWISFYQLFVDFQCSTGDAGPVYIGGWVDPHSRPNILQTPADFRKRCAWFTKLFKHVATVGGAMIHTATTRPESISLQLHAPVIWISWPKDRLQWIEMWFSRHLSKAATRDGSSLRSLPLAKRDWKWPAFQSCEEPLRF